MLFNEFGSEEDEVTEPVLVIVAGAFDVTTKVITALSLLFMFPRLHVTVLVPVHDPRLGVAETRALPGGNVSVTLTLVAVSGPLFVT